MQSAAWELWLEKSLTVIEGKEIDRATQQLLLLGGKAETGYIGGQDRGREVAEEERICIQAKMPVEESLNSRLQNGGLHQTWPSSGHANRKCLFRKRPDELQPFVIHSNEAVD